MAEAAQNWVPGNLWRKTVRTNATLRTIQASKLTRVNGPHGSWCEGSSEEVKNGYGRLEEPQEATGCWYQHDMFNMEPWRHGVTLLTHYGVCQRRPQHEL